MPTRAGFEFKTILNNVISVLWLMFVASVGALPSLTCFNHFCFDLCRDNAFKLKPLEMSDQLISHLKALETKLHAEARKLQDLVNKGKDKMKYYKEIIEEAGFVHELQMYIYDMQFIC